ncbi:MAG: ECF transporter S component [Oscillospiraceae bacterium]|nr:ECF transporter S component [Oscillospiraceae bacterium]
MKKTDIKKLVTLSMLCAMAYTVMFVFKGTPPLMPFPPLKFDPKDVVILLGGFLYGPLAAVAMSAVVSVLEMVSVSATGWVGCIQNIVSTCAFVVPACIIYQKRKTLGGAIVGLSVGVISVTIIMTLFNYIFVPIFMATPEVSVAEWRERTKGLLLPVFAPFNLFKSSANAVIVILLFKPVTSALHKADLIEPAIVGTRSSLMKWLFVVIAAVVSLGFFLFLIL